MNKRISLAAVLLVSLMPELASSRVTGWVNVLQVGGQSSNTFVVLSETVGDDLGCPNTRLVIPPGAFADADAQRRFYAAASIAVATGQKMQLAVSGCSGGFPSMIASDFWFLQGN
jgi:hypothetical protein